jgi:hypothetical protein
MDLKHHNPPPANVVAVRREHGNNDRLNDLEAVRTQLTDEMRAISPNDFPSQAEFEMAYADLQSRHGDATQRHANLTRRLEQDYPHLTNNARYLIGSGNPLTPIPSITRSGANARIRAAYRAYLEDVEGYDLPQEELAQSLIAAEYQLAPGHAFPQEYGLNTDEELNDLARMLTEHGDAINYYDQRGANVVGQPVPEQQLAQQPQVAEEAGREPTELQRVMQAQRNESTQRLRDAMGDQQAFEVDETANWIFGNYDHGDVADVIHGLRNGDATAADGLYRDFSMRQRELLARELDRRLPTGEDAEPAQPQVAEEARREGEAFAGNNFNDAIANGIDDIDSTIYALYSDTYDNPNIVALAEPYRGHFVRAAATEMTRLADLHDLNESRRPMTDVVAPYITNNPAAVAAYNRIMAQMPAGMSLNDIHNYVTEYKNTVAILGNDNVRRMHTFGLDRQEDVLPTYYMLDTHLNRVNQALARYENRRMTPNIAAFEPDDQHGANQPGLGVNPTYQIETAQTSLPRPVIDFLDSFFRINNIDSHPENILEEAYHDLLEHITREERGTLWELTPRQRDEALIHVDTVMQNMGLNVDFDDVDQPQAQLPAPAAAPPEAGQQLNRAIVNAYTEPLQFATTPGSNRLMQAIIDHVDTITNNMFGIGYSPEQIAQAALERFNSYRNEIAGTTPQVLGVDRDSYNNFLEMLRYAIDDLGAIVNGPQQQQAQLPAPEQQQVADADPIARHIQTAALTDLQASLRTDELNEVRELADEAAHPNNVNTPTDFRALAQSVRQHSQGQVWSDFNHVQRELLARQLEEHATDIDRRQRPPGHKKGGYITSKPSIDEMRFALMKGK